MADVASAKEGQRATGVGHHGRLRQVRPVEVALEHPRAPDVEDARGAAARVAQMGDDVQAGRLLAGKAHRRGEAQKDTKQQRGVHASVHVCAAAANWPRLFGEH